MRTRNVSCYLKMAYAFFLLFASFSYAQKNYPPQMEGARVETYRTVGETELKLWIFGETDPNVKKPAIIFFFGGGWVTGTPEHFYPQAKHFASRGMIAICADYRVKSRNNVQVIECVKDAKVAFAWVRSNAERLGIDPNKICASGGSAGGHLAATLGTVSGIENDERPNAMILYNPAVLLASLGDVVIPPGRAELSSARLGVEGKVISPAHHIGEHTPPTLILHGKSDTTVPYESAVAFEKEMKKANRPVTLIGYPGATHGFFTTRDYLEKTTTAADRFLVELGWIDKK